ncbi:conserved hypothetical protein [Luminiphilus syltensis NOR5-1B]|uniref:Transporter n=2 Tax=Luminiphilus TaxID=1341118 RepID=B8KSG3_9GAMM|nr:conserved hypothetical protein [Luminiphilus syltensis NOR5-1B]
MTLMPFNNSVPRLRRVLPTIALALPAFASSQEGGQTDIAAQLANPIASLISVPIQANYDDNFGIDDKGSVFRTNVQPVIPFSLNEDWNVISRTILPIIDQQDTPFVGYSEFGLGDVTQSLFFSPSKPTAGGWTWGAGPAFLLPTATDEFLGAEQWGVGPTAVALKQSGPWTFGGLVNHIESFVGDDDRGDISATFLQPFVSYITPTKTTFSMNLESTYNWENTAWSVPINLQVSQLLKFGDQLMQLGAGVRYRAESPDQRPEGWGVRLNVVFVYPR